MIFNGGIYNKNWNTKKLSDLGTFARGVSKHRPRNDAAIFEGGGYPLIQTADIKSSNLYINKHISEYNSLGLKQSKLWPAGTLCITIAANIAETGILSYPMCFPDSVVGFLSDENQTSETFMYYIFEYIRHNIEKGARGSTQDNINIEYLTNLAFKIPDKEYQDKLIKILVSIDNKINLNAKINDNLQQLLELIYEQWFYRFEFNNGKKVELVWNETIKRQIPLRWKVQNMYENDLFSVVSSGINPFKTKTYYATADINGNSIGDGSKIDYETRESRANMQPYINSVWFAKMKNSIKHLFLNDEMHEFVDNSILSTGFYGLKCTDKSFEYISSVISSPIFEITKDKLSHGATQQGIGDDDLKNMLLLVPDDETLANYHETTKNLYSSISNNIIENKKLAALRDFLLPLLMNGQATIQD